MLFIGNAKTLGIDLEVLLFDRSLLPVTATAPATTKAVRVEVRQNSMATSDRPWRVTHQKRQWHRPMSSSKLTPSVPATAPTLEGL
jgi:hypothetical protein